MIKTNKFTSCESCNSLDKSIFCELEKMSLKEVDEHKVVNNYKKGHTLFFQDNPPFGLYCINKGKVKISKIGAAGKESIIRIAGEGDVLGHRSLFSKENYTATATALEDSVICFIDKKYIFELIRNKPVVSLQLIQKLSIELGAAENKYASHSQKNVRERLAEFLLTLNESYGVKEGNRSRLDIKLTREEIASIIGTASETVIRFITEFKDEGLIEQEGKTIFITDPQKLLSFANLNY